ncbi:homoserine O-acetyltransferase [Halobacillus andaensis]|uniref:Homoserine O-acetyltransferase n=1 Tax=Halobacillus andaensis TaxID=1176239 RepID=A0A917B509_HALAA|nr:homoserine O-acetyltransferase [Halobacillus andaensis]MBP2004537.1 homoserine O-acetyltransferase [Halobacillus andaensis]GGF20908.1 homoserine O-acetyltransferase [Halobacillus andaensis]
MSIKNVISQQAHTKVSIGSFTLESGETLQDVELAYERYGPENAPVILICHALTGNQHAVGSSENPGWWNGLVGDGCAIDTTAFQVVTFNVLGGCHGSTGPASINPETKEPYRLNFPKITIRDIVHSQYEALKLLDIHEVHAVVGGSLGGMQTLEWGLLYPTFMKQLYALAATPYLSDYGIAFNHIGARAIQDDPAFSNGNYDKNEQLHGFEIARMAGMVTYRSGTLFQKRFDRHQSESLYDIQSYMDYQGEKIKERFDANSYLYLLEAMNHHDIRRSRGTLQEAATQYQVPLFTVSFEHDLLYPKELIKPFSQLAANSEHLHVQTDYGHDGFLVEFNQWGSWLYHKLNEGAVNHHDN